MQVRDCVFLLYLVMATAGCASGPAPKASRHPVPMDRMFAPALLVPSAERTSSFSLTRDVGYVGSAAGIDVFVEGQRVACLAASETVTVYVTPGRHLLGARFSWGPTPPTEREFVATTEGPVKVRITTEAHSTNLNLKPESGLL